MLWDTEILNTGQQDDDGFKEEALVDLVRLILDAWRMLSRRGARRYFWTLWLRLEAVLLLAILGFIGFAGS